MEIDNYRPVGYIVDIGIGHVNIAPQGQELGTSDGSGRIGKEVDAVVYIGHLYYLRISKNRLKISYLCL
jgi:hypothetical protein